MDDRSGTQRSADSYIDIVFDGPPGQESGRFVEVEDAPGKSIRIGEWVHRPDGYWVLRFDAQEAAPIAKDPAYPNGRPAGADYDYVDSPPSDKPWRLANGDIPILERAFDAAYQRAGETSQPSDWMEAALIAQQLRTAARSSIGAWIDGVPPHPYDKEWFIAETTYGDRVVLTALPEEYTYDFKTADDTYIKADKIKRWMQFPDSQFTHAQRSATVPFTHQHADGGLYRYIGTGKYKTAADDAVWSDAIVYEDKNGRLYVTTPARWSDRFTALGTVDSGGQHG